MAFTPSVLDFFDAPPAPVPDCVFGAAFTTAADSAAAAALCCACVGAPGGADGFVMLLVATGFSHLDSPVAAWK
jgi:hypothetical protein